MQLQILDMPHHGVVDLLLLALGLIGFTVALRILRGLGLRLFYFYFGINRMVLLFGQEVAGGLIVLHLFDFG